MSPEEIKKIQSETVKSTLALLEKKGVLNKKVMFKEAPSFSHPVQQETYDMLKSYFDQNTDDIEDYENHIAGIQAFLAEYKKEYEGWKAKFASQNNGAGF